MVVADATLHRREGSPLRSWAGFKWLARPRVTAAPAWG